jgi:protocatechuate 3,4-dioxygenase beta subunit
MRMTRLTIFSALLLADLGAIGAATCITQDQEPGRAQSAAPSQATQRLGPAGLAAPENVVQCLTVRVVDTQGRGVPDVDVMVIEVDATPEVDGPGYRAAAYRTGVDGRVRISAATCYERLTLEARPDPRTVGWASLRSGQTSPKGSEDDPITLTLLSRNHQVDGTVVDARGKPIRGVQVRAVQFNHDANGFATDYARADERPSLASAVTDEVGRYRLSLPEATTVIFQAYHPWFVGQSFHCRPDGRTVPPATLVDAGGIAGTLVDARTGRPVEGAEVDAQRIELSEHILNGNWGSAVSDAEGHFRVGGLAPGVYNVLFGQSPKGRRFTARAAEGVRVKAGDDARADLRMIEGRRLRGMAVIAETGAPLVGAPIFCYNPSHPRSGAACQGTYTDGQGRFEHFVPPGPALVYIALPGLVGSEHRKALDVLDNRDLDLVTLKRTTNPNAEAFENRAHIVECEVRVRVKADVGGGSAPGEERIVSGRVFDKDGSPLSGVQVYYNSRKLIEAATDRLGVFRLKGLPHGRLWLGLRWNGGGQHGSAIIPAEAAQVDLIFP